MVKNLFRIVESLTSFLHFFIGDGTGQKKNGSATLPISLSRYGICFGVRKMSLVLQAEQGSQNFLPEPAPAPEEIAFWHIF